MQENMGACCNKINSDYISRKTLVIVWVVEHWNSFFRKVAESLSLVILDIQMVVTLRNIFRL